MCNFLRIVNPKPIKMPVKMPFLTIVLVTSSILRISFFYVIIRQIYKGFPMYGIEFYIGITLGVIIFLAISALIKHFKPLKTV